MTFFWEQEIGRWRGRTWEIADFAQGAEYPIHETSSAAVVADELNVGDGRRTTQARNCRAGDRISVVLGQSAAKNDRERVFVRLGCHFEFLQGCVQAALRFGI